MNQDNAQIYYMVVDEKSTGPFTLDEITLHPKLTLETLVWKPGLENWIAAKHLPELSPAFKNQNTEGNPIPPEYNNPEPGNQEFNPSNTNQGNYQGNQGNNPFANNPQYNPHHTYQNQNTRSHYGQYNHHHDGRYNDYNRYNDQYRPNFRTNWLPWAIVATVLGFFTSCIGAIFGIIGIVQANKANTFYAQGFDREAEAANSNARIMTIIGLIFAGLGIIAAIWFGSIFGSLSNLSYL